MVIVVVFDAVCPDGVLAFRVVEMSSVIAAPTVGRVMADFGAEVIKIEHGSGDLMRKKIPGENRTRPCVALA